MESGDLAGLVRLGLDQTMALRAMAQGMAWVRQLGDAPDAGATARLADGTVFLDGLVGSADGRLALIDHAVAYGKWSDAPAVTLCDSTGLDLLETRGFVGLDPARLPDVLRRAAADRSILMKRL